MLTISLSVICSSSTFVGKQHDIVIGLEEEIDVRPRPGRRYGTAGPITNLFRELWKDEIHVFAAEGLPQQEGQGPKELGHPDQTPSDTLNRYPVDVLTIEETSTSKDEQARYWARWLDACQPQNQPTYVIVSAATSELVEDSGLQSKTWRRRFTRWGYTPDFWFVRGHQHGGGRPA
jgi:hypothetical protein